ncbi:MAG: zf-HC2 domain-containing protein [Terriglobales bacterium]
MKCSDVDRILPDIVDGTAIDGSQDLEVQSHLKTCPDCSELISDLKLIANEARHLAASEEPSPRVWARLVIELRAEGLIREPELETARPVVEASRRRWNPLWLAPVAAAILAAGAFVLNHNPTRPTAQPIDEQTVAQQPRTQAAQKTPSREATTQQASAQQAANTTQPSALQQLAQEKPSVLAPEPATPQVDEEPAESPAEEGAVNQPTSAADNEFLTEVSQRAPTMRATYANQLQAVNKEIRETQEYITRNPGDVDARQHLLECYEQKAMFYQIALDRIQ